MAKIKYSRTRGAKRHQDTGPKSIPDEEKPYSITDRQVCMQVLDLLAIIEDRSSLVTASIILKYHLESIPPSIKVDMFENVDQLKRSIDFLTRGGQRFETAVQILKANITKLLSNNPKPSDATAPPMARPVPQSDALVIPIRELASSISYAAILCCVLRATIGTDKAEVRKGSCRGFPYSVAPQGLRLDC